MSYFTATRETIPPGLGIAQFGPEHLCWLGAAGIVCVLLCRLARRTSPDGKRRLRRVLVGLMLADELAKHAILLACGHWELSYLPLHVCSIHLFVCLCHELRPRWLSGELLYAVCLPTAWIALLCPSWTALPVWNFMSIHSFTIHTLLACYPAVLLAEGSLRPQARHLTWVVLVYTAIGLLLYCFNQRFGTNFMFLRVPGSGNPLVWFEARLGTPGYIAGIPLMAGGIWLCTYGLPALWRRCRRQRA